MQSFLMLKQLVYIVTTGLDRVKSQGTWTLPVSTCNYVGARY